MRGRKVIGLDRGRAESLPVSRRLTDDRCDDVRLAQLVPFDLVDDAPVRHGDVKVQVAPCVRLTPAKGAGEPGRFDAGISLHVPDNAIEEFITQKSEFDKRAD